MNITLTCPVCGLKHATLGHIMGHEGGKTTGPSKARTHEQAVAAGKAGAAKRWGKK